MPREAVQSVCIHVHLKLGQPLWDAAGYLEIVCAPCCSQIREQHRCYC